MLKIDISTKEKFEKFRIMAEVMPFGTREVSIIIRDGKVEIVGEMAFSPNLARVFAEGIVVAAGIAEDESLHAKY